MDSVKQFLESRQSRAWLSLKDMDIYVRKASHHCGGKLLWTIDLATITVRWKKRGTGIFTRFLVDLTREAVPNEFAVYVENVLTERFAEWFRRNRWHEKPSLGPSDFWQTMGELRAAVDERTSDASDGELPRVWGSHAIAAKDGERSDSL